MPFIWHITTKFSGWFTSILRNQYSNWCIEFYKLYKLDSCEEFEGQWTQLMEKYDMLTNKHVIGLYQIRHFSETCHSWTFFWWNDNNWKIGKYKCLY